MSDKKMVSATVSAKCRICDEVVHHEVFSLQDGYRVTNEEYWASSNRCLMAMEEHYRENHNVTDIFDIE